MATDIVVQGEHYEDVEELQIAIESLERTLEEMPSDAPEHADLQRHVDRLRKAAEEAGSESGEPLHSPEPSPEPASDAVEDEDGDAETTTNIRESFETGNPLLCPLCGHEVDYAELPPMDNTVETCSNCKGWGNVVRPTKVDGQIWHTCAICQGNGYVPKQGEEVRQYSIKAVSVPEAPGASWNAETEDWNPPAGEQPPWAGATWDRLRGRWG